MQILFYFIVILALAGLAYYGWTSAKRAQNRTETKSQARIRQGLDLVTVLLVLVGLIFSFSLIGGVINLTGNGHLIESGLRLVFGSSLVLEVDSSTVTLLSLCISLLHPLINGGLLLILRGFLNRLYKGEKALETLTQPLNWAGHLLLLKALISPGIFSIGQGNQATTFFNFGYSLVAILFYVLARLVDQEK